MPPEPSSLRTEVKIDPAIEPTETELPEPTLDDIWGVMDDARAGDKSALDEFQRKFRADALWQARDEEGNAITHMLAGNGLVDILDALLPPHVPDPPGPLLHVPPSSSPLTPTPSLLPCIKERNRAGSTPLHWAARNGHLKFVRSLLSFASSLPGPSPPPSPGSHVPRGAAKASGSIEGRLRTLEASLLEARNAAGRTPVTEAEGQDRQDVVNYLLERMEVVDSGRFALSPTGLKSKEEEDVKRLEEQGESAQDVDEKDTGEAGEEVELFKVREVDLNSVDGDPEAAGDLEVDESSGELDLAGALEKEGEQEERRLEERSRKAKAVQQEDGKERK